MPDFAAPANAAFCSVVSKPPTTMPAGLTASAWLSAAVRPLTVPCPSMTRTVQPMARAASSTPLLTPTMPPFFMSPATKTMVFPALALGPVVGPSHFSLVMVAISTFFFATSRKSSAMALGASVAAHRASTAAATVRAGTLFFMLVSSRCDEPSFRRR